LIRVDRRITTDSLATALGCSHGSAHSMTDDSSKFLKVHTRWVPRELKGLSLQHLLQYADEEEDMLNRIVTGDKSWVHHYSYQPKSKCASMQCKHPSSRSTKRFKVTPSAGKVMLTVLWDSQEVLLAHFQKHGGNMNSALYREVLLKLRNAIRRKCTSQLEHGYCFIMTMSHPIQPE
jgi:hypothetical protein